MINKKDLVLVLSISSSIVLCSIIGVQTALAQILEKDAPIPPNINTTLTMTDPPQRDVSIDVLDEPLPANGTTSISTTGANDIDITTMPPAGYTIVITNDTASVTNHVVEIPTAEEVEIGAADDNGGNGNNDNNG